MDPVEQWMVRQNVKKIESGEEDARWVIGVLRVNGYDRVANAVEEAIAKKNK